MLVNVHVRMFMPYGLRVYATVNMITALLKVVGKQEIGSLTVFFPVVCIKKSHFFIYNVAMALLYTFLS